MQSQIVYIYIVICTYKYIYHLIIIDVKYALCELLFQMRIEYNKLRMKLQSLSVISIKYL